MVLGVLRCGGLGGGCCVLQRCVMQGGDILASVGLALARAAWHRRSTWSKEAHGHTVATQGPNVGTRLQANVRTGGGEAMYDQRLFNQEGGLASGLEADDAYNTYDKPLFAERGTGLHRAPARAADDDADEEAGVRTEKFKPDRVRGLAGRGRACSTLTLKPNPEPRRRMQPRRAVTCPREWSRSASLGRPAHLRAATTRPA
jgi:hypothetical protein